MSFRLEVMVLVVVMLVFLAQSSHAAPFLSPGGYLVWYDHRMWDNNFEEAGESFGIHVDALVGGTSSPDDYTVELNWDGNSATLPYSQVMFMQSYFYSSYFEEAPTPIVDTAAWETNYTFRLKDSQGNVLDTRQSQVPDGYLGPLSIPVTTVHPDGHISWDPVSPFNVDTGDTFVRYRVSVMAWPFTLPCTFPLWQSPVLNTTSFDLSEFLEPGTYWLRVDARESLQQGAVINRSLYYTKYQTPVPEPATMLLLGSGVVGLAGFRKRLGKKN